MAKVKTHYVCRECGASHSKWSGQCADCSEWNTLEAFKEIPQKEPAPAHGYSGQKSEVTSLSDVSVESVDRYTSGNSELDRVLGGGLVPGSIVLLGGDPGIGKSTLLLQTLSAIAQTRRVLYVTGEESLQQVRMRAARLGLNAGDIRIMAETNVESILNAIQKETPSVVVVDSIQTMFTTDVGSAPGAVSQVRESTARLVRYAKQNDTTIVLVGHVTKDGALAGPRVLEHMVDSVLYFESDAGSRYRLIRAVKNRFGAANELGVFVMAETGLKGVSNPSSIFLTQHEKAVPGSAIMVTWEGTRPLLVEIQALVDQSHANNARRVAIGLDQNRLGMLLAVLQRHAGTTIYDHDVFINAVGGVRVGETAADLPIISAVLSSLYNQPLPKGWVLFGELGLAGEIRPVPNGIERLKEAAKHGYTHAIVPEANTRKTGKQPLPLKVRPVSNLGEAVDAIKEGWG